MTPVIDTHKQKKFSNSFPTGTLRKVLNRIRGTLSEEIPPPRVPIWLQFSVTTMFVLAVTVSVLSYVIMVRQKENLYNHIVKLGTVSLNYISNNAKVSLLTNDTLALNTLVNNVASVEGHSYAFIVDSDGRIKAHTDHHKIDKPLEPFPAADKKSKNGSVTYFNYTLPDESHVLNLSMPVAFQDKNLGTVHIGLSTDFIKSLYFDERAFLAFAALVIIFLGMIVAILVSLRFSKPLSTLVDATTQIAKGNYNFTVDLKRNDEFGTLGTAFNRMGSELFRQSMIKESFGKYVGPEVLDLIIKNPEGFWLKGQKNSASILFADIRGFTRYSESREPEEVVEELNEFFAIATDVILRHGGYVDKFIGDSVLAVFGVPVFRHNHLENCIRAAVDMQKELTDHARNGNTLLASIGIGITSGVVVAGNIGSQVKMEYTVIGDSVNVASYLNTLADAGEIIVGNDTDTEIGNFVHLEPLAPQKVKGRENLVNVYRVTGLKKESENH